MKKLKITAIIISLVLIGLIAYLFLKFQSKKEIAEELQNIPAFSLQMLGGKPFTNKNLPAGKKVFIYFNPSCEYCQAEAEELSEILHSETPPLSNGKGAGEGSTNGKEETDRNKYRDYHFIFISSVSKNEIEDFAKKYKLFYEKNITWLQDKNANFYTKFKITTIPYILAYDEHNRLIFKNKGAIKPDKIFQQITPIK